MEVTLEDIKQLEQDIKQLERKIDQRLTENQSNIIKWIVGLFVGAIIVIGASVTMAITAVMLVTQ